MIYLDSMDKCIYLTVVPYGYLVSMREKKPIKPTFTRRDNFLCKRNVQEKNILGRLLVQFEISN